jgi:hypothetical protein
MSHGHPHKSRYARLVSAFAASAFALLITLSAQQQTANAATASVVNGTTVMTNYKKLTKCPTEVKNNPNFRNLGKMCTLRSLITTH